MVLFYTYPLMFVTGGAPSENIILYPCNLRL